MSTKQITRRTHQKITKKLKKKSFRPSVLSPEKLRFRHRKQNIIILILIDAL